MSSTIDIPSRSSLFLDSGLAARQPLDRGVLWGIGICSTFLVAAVLLGGEALNFLHLPSLLLVGGGTFGATLIHFSPKDFRFAWASLRAIAREPEGGNSERLALLVRLSHSVRINGMLALERESRLSSDRFLKQALELAVDGHSPEEIKHTLHNEAAVQHEHNIRAVQVLETLGAYAPGIGLIGTLLGLIQMLKSLGDPALVGSAMSLALVTTLYGAVLANMVFLPLAGKLRLRAEEQVILRTLTIEGAISLSRQDNPIVVEQRLRGFIPAGIPS